jgi:hypothetical protein
MATLRIRAATSNVADLATTIAFSARVLPTAVVESGESLAVAVTTA